MAHHPPKPLFLEKVVKDVRTVIIDFCVGNIHTAVLVPTALVNLTEDGYIKPLEDAEETLICTVKRKDHPFPRTCKQIHSEYASNMWAKILNCKVYRLVVHVVDFDFSLAISELFSQFDKASRDHLNSWKGEIHISLTITPGFALLPQRAGLDKWLEWRRQEEQEGRMVDVDYEISPATTQGKEEMKSLRFFLLLFDPEGKEGGDIGGMMRILRVFYKRVYARRPKT